MSLDTHDPALAQNLDAEQQLSQKQAYLQLAYDAAGIGTLQFDRINDEVLFDARAQVHFGLLTERATAAEMLARVHPQDARRVAEEIASAEQAGSFSSEFRVIHGDGSVRWLSAHARVAYIGEGVDRIPAISFGASRDITERKLAEEQLRLRTEELERILDLLPAVVWIAEDPACHRIRGNRYAEQLLGTPEVANLLQQQPGDAHLRLRQFVEGHELLQTDLPLQRAAREAQPQLDLDLRVERAGHEDVILSGGAVPLFDEQGRVRGAVAAYHDVTARRRVEHDLQCAVEELRRSNADLEQFAYVASHDLQEPLRALSGMVQLLRERYRSQLDSRGMQYIDLAVESASRMQGLISALLTFSRVDRLYTPGKVIDTGAVLRNALANLQVAIEESGATVEQGALPPVVADAVQLTQVFQNLIGNAIKFRGLSPPQIEVGVTQLADAWRFHVRDNGIGIEPQYFERIFLIFQRLHVRHEYPGMGIGLALCKKIIERHGGKIWVESEPGVGATFFFTLPLYEKELAA